MATHRRPTLLIDATVQEIQLELIRRTQFNAFDGERIYAWLLAHRELWEAVMLDRVGFSVPGGLPRNCPIKLRDLPENIWNVDTLYILTPNAVSAYRVADIAEQEDWGGMVQVYDNRDEVNSALGGAVDRQAVVSIWWD